MIQKIKMTFLTLASAMAVIAPIAFAGVVSAAASTGPDSTDEVGNGVCAGVNLDITNNTCVSNDLDKGAGKINSIIKTVINIFSIVVGVIAVIMIIVGGLKYIMSGGDSGNVTGAKNTILYAIIGLVVVAMAQFIVRFVLTKVNNSQTGTTTTN